MLSPTLEIDRLRHHLFSLGISNTRIDSICENSYVAMIEAQMAILNSGVDEAIWHAESIEAYEFIQDLAIDDNDYSLRITTFSGKTDFSTDSVQNLPNLLKNGKVSRDGTIYKNIPIKDEKSPKPQISKSIMEQMQQLQTNQQDARDRIKQKLDVARQAAKDAQAAKYNTKYSGKVHFKTATSKQNPQTSWVIPGKDKDMTVFLEDLNTRMSRDLDDAISQIIDVAMRGA
jgi:hypothetical protein